MTHRDEREALRARIEALTAELAEAREKLAQLEGHSDHPTAPSGTPGGLRSGPWRGVYTYAGQTWRHPTQLVMTFTGARVEGAGEDDVGAFTISGTFDAATGSCRWTKQYSGKHPVTYTATRVGEGLAGRWEIPGTPAGTFALWPGDGAEIPPALERALGRTR